MVAVIVLLPAVLLIAFSLTYDWSGKVRASEEAVAVAQQAARAGVNEGMAPDTHQGGVGAAPSLDPAAARQGAQAFLTQAGVQGTVSVTGDRVVVTTQVDYQPKYLTMVGTLTGKGRGEASPEGQGSGA